MTEIVLAAVSASPACAPVLGFAKLFASALRHDARALHVVEDHRSDTVGDVAFREGVDLQMVDGDPVREIVRAGHHPDVGMVVIGARDLRNHAGPGHVTREVAMRLRRPLLVVPLDAVVPAAIECLLIPLEGTQATTAPIRALFERSRFDPETEVVTLHSYSAEDAPPFANHEPHDTEERARAFRDRYVPTGVRGRVLTRYGPAEQVVPEVAASVGATLTVVSWAQDLTLHRARLVKALLAHPARPTLLLPSNGEREAERDHDRAAHSANSASR